MTVVSPANLWDCTRNPTVHDYMGPWVLLERNLYCCMSFYFSHRGSVVSEINGQYWYVTIHWLIYVFVCYYTVTTISRWRKLIKDVWWSGWVWVGECFFWYWHTCVVPDKGPLIGCVRVCVCYYHYYYFFQFLNCQATQPQVFARHPCPVPTPTVQPCHVLSAWECSGCSSFIDYRYKCYSTYFSKCIVTYICLQCFDAVGWAAGRASGL